jgi:hypothetical protein
MVTLKEEDPLPVLACAYMRATDGKPAYSRALWVSEVEEEELTTEAGVDAARPEPVRRNGVATSPPE